MKNYSWWITLNDRKLSILNNLERWKLLIMNNLNNENTWYSWLLWLFIVNNSWIIGSPVLKIFTVLNYLLKITSSIANGNEWYESRASWIIFSGGFVLKESEEWLLWTYESSFGSFEVRFAYSWKALRYNDRRYVSKCLTSNSSIDISLIKSRTGWLAHKKQPWNNENSWLTY